VIFVTHKTLLRESTHDSLCGELVCGPRHYNTWCFMSHNDSVIATFETHTLAEGAVRKLQQAGFDMTTLSIVGKGYHTDEHVVGYFNAGDRMLYWGANGAFWGALWSILLGSAVFSVPGVGPLLVAGPLAGAIIAVLESAAITGGLSAMGAALFSIGIPHDSVLRYESLLKAGEYLMVVHGSPEDVARAESLLEHSGMTRLELHPAKTPLAVTA
jgi:hypothetical protein